MTVEHYQDFFQRVADCHINKPLSQTAKKEVAWFTHLAIDVDKVFTAKNSTPHFLHFSKRGLYLFHLRM